MLVRDLRLHDHELFFRYFRMSPTQFEHLVQLVAPSLIKDESRRESIRPPERLAVTLRYLCTGDAQTTIATAYRMSPTVVGRILYETLDIIWKVLMEQGYISVPSTEDQWKSIATDFETKWNFHNCLGAIDEKQVIIQAPPRLGSMYFNYKKTFSIVLMAVCDANYQFTMVDIGESGRCSDGGVFGNSCLGNAILNQTMGMPKSGVIEAANMSFPYVFVADDAFPLKVNIMKPYSRETMQQKERIFNYRLSRARRVIENVFGIAASRFRVLRRPIIAKVETTTRATKAIVALHNYLMKNRRFESASHSYCPAGHVDIETANGLRMGNWRQEVAGDQGLQPINQVGSHNYSRDAKETRNAFRDFFNSHSGAVPWQLNAICDPGVINP